MKVLHIDEINNKIKENEQEFIFDSEREYQGELQIATDKIFERFTTNPIVLVSGPSGSGKTTTAISIEKMLEKKGIKAHSISMDNYFLPITDGDDTPRNSDGSIDFESPYRMDIPLIMEHLSMLNEGKEIAMPIFEFKTNSVIGHTPLKRNSDELIILEGIHALNPIVTGRSKDFATSIYVSVRTRIENTEMDRLHPRLIRLMRRLSRDMFFRGRAIPDTFAMFKSVSRGEEMNIMKFKANADFDIDTFIPFEPSAYKTRIYDNLVDVYEEMHGNFDYDMIMSFLKDIDNLDLAKVPSDSLIREFIG